MAGVPCSRSVLLRSAWIKHRLWGSFGITSPKYGFVAKFADFPDDYDVVADCRDGLKSALLEYAHFHVGHIRKEAGLPYQWQRIKLTFKRVSEEEFGPLFDETWDED